MRTHYRPVTVDGKTAVVLGGTSGIGRAIHLASDAASYTNGEILTVDDGFTASAFDR